MEFYTSVTMFNEFSVVNEFGKLKLFRKFLKNAQVSKCADRSDTIFEIIIGLNFSSIFPLSSVINFHSGSLSQLLTQVRIDTLWRCFLGIRSSSVTT